MLFFQAFSPFFWVFYSLAGASDLFDGLLARKLKQESKLGAILDSIADLVFFVTLCIILFQAIYIPPWLLIASLAVLVLRVSAYLVAFIKTHEFVSIHTYLNKLTGLLLFFFPVLYYFLGLLATGIILIAVSSLSSLEELILDISSKEADRDRKGLLFKQNKVTQHKNTDKTPSD